MNPEERIAQLEAIVSDLQQQIKSLHSFNTIPFSIEKAFSSRLGVKNFQSKVTDLTSEFGSNPLSVQVDESGGSSYRVMDQPDYVLRIPLAQYGENFAVAVGAFDY